MIIRARWLDEQQNCAQEIAIHRLDGSPSDAFEIHQLLKERRSPHADNRVGRS
jgi:hypothetical protein